MKEAHRSRMSAVLEATECTRNILRAERCADVCRIYNQNKMCHGKPSDRSLQTATAATSFLLKGSIRHLPCKRWYLAIVPHLWRSSAVKKIFRKYYETRDEFSTRTSSFFVLVQWMSLYIDMKMMQSWDVLRLNSELVVHHRRDFLEKIQCDVPLEKFRSTADLIDRLNHTRQHSARHGDGTHPTKMEVFFSMRFVETPLFQSKNVFGADAIHN